MTPGSLPRWAPPCQAPGPSPCPGVTLTPCPPTSWTRAWADPRPEWWSPCIGWEGSRPGQNWWQGETFSDQRQLGDKFFFGLQGYKQWRKSFKLSGLGRFQARYLQNALCHGRILQRETNRNLLSLCWGKINVRFNANKWPNFAGCVWDQGSRGSLSRSSSPEPIWLLNISRILTRNTMPYDYKI